MSYATLPDPVVGHKDSFVKAVCNFKFCSLGLVVSNTWTAGYVTVVDGVLRLYDSRRTYENDQQNHVLMIPLLKGHFVSDMATKQLPHALIPVHDFAGAHASKAHIAPGTHYSVYEFYLMYDIGLQINMRQLKISTFDEKASSELKRIIALNAN